MDGAWFIAMSARSFDMTRSEEIHNNLLREIAPYEADFEKWLDDNEGKMDWIDLYERVTQYPISEMAKMHLVHSAGRALYEMGWR